MLAKIQTLRTVKRGPKYLRDGLRPNSCPEQANSALECSSFRSPMTLTAANQTVFSNPYNLQTVHTVSTATIPAGQNLLSYEQDFFQRDTTPVPTCGCTFTQGYWSNKPGVVWPAGLPQRDDLFFNSGRTYQQIMDASLRGGNAYLNLAHQYIAATLNAGNGACEPQSVVDLIGQSNTFFSGFAAGSYFCASNPRGCPLQVTWAGILADSLRAKIDETAFLVVITEQGEKRNQT